MKTKYKVIASGSGPGSSVARSEIANKGIEVLMLEMGNDFRETSFTEYSTDEIASKYKNAGQTVSLGNSIINYAEVCVLEAEAKLTVVYIIDALNLFLKNGSQKMDLKFQS